VRKGQKTGPAGARPTCGFAVGSQGQRSSMNKRERREFGWLCGPGFEGP